MVRIITAWHKVVMKRFLLLICRSVLEVNSTYIMAIVCSKGQVTIVHKWTCGRKLVISW